MHSIILILRSKTELLLFSSNVKESKFERKGSSIALKFKSFKG